MNYIRWQTGAAPGIMDCAIWEGCHHSLWTVVQEQSPADAEGIARQIVSFSVHACSVIFPERKDET